MPTEITTTRRKVKSKISQVLSTYGAELTECGGKYEAINKPVSVETGYWEDISVSNKPTRMILHLFPDAQGGMTAGLPGTPESGRFAFANTANRKVGALLVRVVPAVKLGEDRFHLHEGWEWLLWYCFSPPLKSGSSGQLLDGFDPEHGTFRYIDGTQKYIAAGLVKLCDDGETFMPPPDAGLPPLTYGIATGAVSDLIHVEVGAVPQAETPATESEPETHPDAR